MADTYVQVPPQSTGKKLATEARSKLGYDNLTGSLSSFSFGTVITGATSGATGIITGIDVQTTTSGDLYLQDYTGTFTNNESLEIDATGVALANITSSVETLEQQKMVITDPDQPDRMQKVDRFGSALATFSGGSPIFTPFGLLMTGQSQVIRDYRFAYEEDAGKFWDQEVSGATVSYESNTGVILFSTPTTSGALASRTSNYYHQYQPGVGTLYETSLAIGDTGKANVRRRWGMFDDSNGVFWQLDGTTLGVVIRSNTDGTVSDNPVTQANFNTDKLNGTDSLGFDIDVSKPNIYWIDFQWLGSGRVRFGVLEPNGTRITAHDFEHSNTGTTIPYMRTGTLPVRYEQENTGVAGSTSEMRWACATVKNTASVPILSESTFTGNTGATPVSVDATSETPVISIRPATTYAGRTNRSVIRFKSISYHNDGTNAVLFTVGVTTDGSMAGESFASPTGSAAEIDTSATSATLLVENASQYVNAGESVTVLLNQDPHVHTEELVLGADGTTQQVVTWVAQGVGGPSSVSMAVNWEEIRL